MLTCSFRRLALILGIVGLVTLASSAPAHAALSVTLKAVNPVAAGDTGASGGNGALAISLDSGQFSADGAAVGEDVLGSASMDMTSISVSSSGAGEVWLIFSMNNIDSPVGPGSIFQSITGQFLAGAAGTIAFTTFGDLDNTLYTTEPVSNAPTVVGTPVVNVLGGSSSVLWISDNQYSLTQVLKINFLTGGSVALSSDSFSNFSVPEPTTFTMFGLGTIAMAFGAIRRRFRTTAT